MDEVGNRLTRSAPVAALERSEGPSTRFAFISEDDDLGPIGSSRSYLSDQPFVALEPPLSDEDYNFALEASEGIADLFDQELLLSSGH